MSAVDPGPFLAAALGAQSGTATRIRRGAMGAIWRLDLTGHRARTLAAKEFIEYVPAEQDVANELALRDAAAAAGVPSPASVAFRSGHVAKDPDTGRGWRCYDWVDGHQAADDRETRLWLFRQLATIHRLEQTGPPPPPTDSWYLRVNADWNALVAAVRAAGLPWAPRFEQLVEESVPGLCSFVAGVPAGTPIWTHRDLQPSNVMIDDEGRRQLVDWDNAGGHSDWRELGSQLIADLAAPDDLCAGYETYLAAGGTARVTGPGVFATPVVVGLNFLAEQVRRLADPATSDDDRDYAAGWLPRLLDDLPDPVRLAEAVRPLISPSR